MTTVEIPNPTKRRFVQLIQLLDNWSEQKITSSDISEITGWSTSLIRHDFWLIGFSKGVSNGYFVSELSEAIKLALRIETSESHYIEKGNVADENRFSDSNDSRSFFKNICIAGLGRLGSALLDESFFENSNFKIKAGFDSNVNRVEILRSTFPLYPANEMQFIIKQQKIEYAILTVQDKDAQNMTDRLIKTGIKGIINMTNVILKVPDNIKVENLSIINALNLVI